MTNLLLILRAIRWPNLLMMATTLLLARYCILLPVYTKAEVALQMPLLYFTMLLLATLMIGAGGYIVNDILDAGLDELNKPGVNSIGRQIPEKSAWKAYYAVNIVGVALGGVVSFVSGNPVLTILFLIIATALYYYSLKYKYLPFWGNFTVSLLTAMTVIIVWLFEFFFLKQSAADFITISRYFHLLNKLIFGVAFLAFFLSMIREIVKDAQDVKGDERFGSRTIPIILGEKPTRWLIAGLLIMSVMVMAGIQVYIFHRYRLVAIVLFLIQLMAVYAMARLSSNKGNTNYRQISSIVKAMMAGGLLSIIFLWFPN
jgi:4-hydroxybenzoate polyprenyltransferase